MLLNRTYYMWYALRDEELVRRFLDYFKTDQDSKWFKCILFTGGAGTGKTRVLVHLTNTPRICFICPTNVSGLVMSDMFYNNTLFGPKSYKTYATLYKFFHEGLRDTTYYRNLMLTSVNASARAGNVGSLDELYSEYNEAFKVISKARYDQMAERLDYIPPKQYEAFRKQVVKTGWLEHCRCTDENDAIVKYMLAMGVSPTKIPDPLMYDTYVIDEAGRLTALEGLQLVHYDRYVHALYNTSCHQANRRPGLLLVGSCTQNKVINKNSQDWKIDDYSLITMVTAPFFRNEPYLCKLNVFNRRCNRGDLDKMACLSHIVERLELGLPMSSKHRDEFLRQFSTPFFAPTPKQLHENRAEVLCRLHIAKRHNVLNKLQESITPSLKSVEVKEFFTCNNDADATSTPYVYRAHEELAACYQSIQYLTDKWDCEGKVQPKQLFLKSSDKQQQSRKRKHSDDEQEDQEEEKEELLWRYSNKRKLLPNMLYKVTHWVNCNLIAIDGELTDFIKDLETYKSCVANNFTPLLYEIIIYMNGWASLIEQQDKDLYDTIMNLSSHIAMLDAAVSGSSEGDGKHSDMLHNLKVEVTSCLQKLATVTSRMSSSSLPIKICLNVRKCLLTQGLTCILEKVEHNSVLLRLGKTFRLRLYKKMVVFKNQSITQFSTRAHQNKGGGYRQQQKQQQQQPLVATIEGWEEEEDLLLMMQQAGKSAKHPSVKHAGKEIVFHFFPLKLFLIETIDCTQSASFNFNHVVQLTPGMAAEDFIVAVTRTEDAGLLNVYFEGVSPDHFYLAPLNHTTRLTGQIFHRRQRKIGWL